MASFAFASRGNQQSDDDSPTPVWGHGRVKESVPTVQSENLCFCLFSGSGEPAPSGQTLEPLPCSLRIVLCSLLFSVLCSSHLHWLLKRKQQGTGSRQTLPIAITLLNPQAPIPAPPNPISERSAENGNGKCWDGQEINSSRSSSSTISGRASLYSGRVMLKPSHTPGTH